MRYSKISKWRARNLWAERKPFIMSARNIRPEFGGVEIDKDYMDRYGEVDFDRMVDQFAYYNCNGVTGRRVAFYVKVE